jgi:NAD(P)-dependent dehydrogenase (short-subunit alcohol dehydrogenase family)
MTLTSTPKVEAMFAAFDARFGPVDVLVNNPYWTDGKGFFEISGANWQGRKNQPGWENTKPMI